MINIAEVKYMDDKFFELMEKMYSEITNQLKQLANIGGIIKGLKK